MKYTAEELRKIYNEYYTSDTNKWALVDLDKARKLVRTIHSWINIDLSENAGKYVLDVGCAQGYISEAFRLQGYSVTGIDYSDMAVEQAKNLFPQCTIIHMDGLDPNLKQDFDIIFCRGFSGSNTHDLDYIEKWMRKYLPYMKPNGYFIIGTWTNFSGKETGEETVNWTKEEIVNLMERFSPGVFKIKSYQYLGILSILKKLFLRYLLHKPLKENIYILLQVSG